LDLASHASAATGDLGTILGPIYHDEVGELVQYVLRNFVQYVPSSEYVGSIIRKHRKPYLIDK
jgi:hypothetical protein